MCIRDSNEGNPLGNYAFSFSTGEAIDTLEVSGNVLAAADLEPVKGMMVGLSLIHILYIAAGCVLCFFKQRCASAQYAKRIGRQYRICCL